MIVSRIKSIFSKKKVLLISTDFQICDGEIKIRAVDARYTGSSRNVFVWNISSARHHFVALYKSDNRTSKLLADCGYGLETFLLAPYRDPF